MTPDVPPKRGRGRPRRNPIPMPGADRGTRSASAIPGVKSINPVDVHVGARLKLRRTLIGMSQTELGNILGLTFQQIQKYEKGQNRLTAGRLMEVADLMGVAVQYFFEDLPASGSRNQPATDPGPGRGRDEDLFSGQLLTPDGALMLHAFNRIPVAGVRRRLINLVNNIANESLPAKASGETD